MKKTGSIKVLWYFLRQYPNIYLSLFFVLLGFSVLEGVNISILLPLFKSALGTMDSASLSWPFIYIDKMIRFLPFNDYFINACILAIAVSFLKEILGFWKEVLSVGYGVANVVYDNQVKVFDKYRNSDYQFFLDNKQGDLIYKLMVSTARLGSCLQYVPLAITALIMTMVIGWLLFSLYFYFTIFLFILGLLFNFVTHILAKKVSYHLGKERVFASVNANVIANEFVDGIKHIKVVDASNLWLHNFKGQIKRFKEIVTRDTMWLSIPERMMQLVPTVALISMALYLRYTKKASSEIVLASLSSMVVYGYAFYRLIPYLTSFGRLRMQIIGTMPDVEVLYNFLHERTNFVRDGNIPLAGFNKEIKLEDVTFSYKGKKDIFKNISFSIQKGKTTAIVGASGMGKTTLVNLIVRLFEPDKGRITIDGIDLKEIKYSSLIELMGLVSQDTFIFNASIRDNIIFGLNDISEEKLIEAAKLANAHEFIMSFPNNYGTIVGDKGLKLSGGQRQRLAIARAILRNPQILILDEATSSLDYYSEALVQQAVNTVSKDRTAIVIAHRLSTVINADKIIVLDRGRVAEEGRHDELMRKNGIYKFLYESQQRMTSNQLEED